MQPKPRHLEADYASQFADDSVVAAYRTRPPYPPELFDLLERAIAPGPRAVIELGCGSGDLTLSLAPRVERLYAVDPSAPMLACAKSRAGADHPAIRWVHASAEAFAYAGPYALAVAAESLHWMDWTVVLPALAASLAPGAGVAIVTERELLDLPWTGPALGALITRYSTNRDFRGYDLVAELSERGLFAETSRQTTAPLAFAQPVADYVESFHSRNGFSLARMEPDAAAAFDAALTDLVARHCPDGVVRARLVSTVCFGRPCAAGID